MTDLPERLWRFATRAARASLSKRSGLSPDDGMQDWEWEVADPSRIDEFIAAYGSGELTEDERFTLMETIIQSFEDTAAPTEHPHWPQLLRLLDENIHLHMNSVWYWALEGSELEDSWLVTPAMRELLARHRAAFEKPSLNSRAEP